MLPFQGTLIDFQGVITSKRGFKSDGWNIVSTWGCWFFIYQRKPSQKSSKKPMNWGHKSSSPWNSWNVASVVLPWPSHITSGPIILKQFWGHVKTQYLWHQASDKPRAPTTWFTSYRRGSKNLCGAWKIYIQTGMRQTHPVSILDPIPI